MKSYLPFIIRWMHRILLIYVENVVNELREQSTFDGVKKMLKLKILFLLCFNHQLQQCFGIGCQYFFQWTNGMYKILCKCLFVFVIFLYMYLRLHSLTPKILLI